MDKKAWNLATGFNSDRVDWRKEAKIRKKPVRDSKLKQSLEEDYYF